MLYRCEFVTSLRSKHASRFRARLGFFQSFLFFCVIKQRSYSLRNSSILAKVWKKIARFVFPFYRVKNFIQWSQVFNHRVKRDVTDRVWNFAGSQVSLKSSMQAVGALTWIAELVVAVVSRIKHVDSSFCRFSFESGILSRKYSH